jgi:rhomboid family GlyGly-CTERM serine protease
MNAAKPVTGLAEMLKSLNCDGRYGLALAAFCLAILLPELWGEQARQLFAYDRAGLRAGQWWRVLTGHAVHLDPTHAFLNALGVALMWALFARDFAARYWAVIALASALAVSAGLWWWLPTLERYVGISGVLHGVMTAGTLAHIRRRDLDGWILAVFIVAKLGYEQYSGSMPFADGGNTIVDAHFYGALGGLAVALFLPSRRQPL